MVFKKIAQISKSFVLKVKKETNEKENHIKIFGKLTRTDFRILKKLKAKHIDLSSISDEIINIMVYTCLF